MSSISSEPNTERRQAVLHFCSLIEQSVLPAEFKEVMKQARIIRVEISTSEKKWRIHLMLDSLVRKKQLDEFAGEIPGLITGLAELDFIVRYNLPGIKPAEIIRGYWEDIIYVISKKHPALSGWMISASKKLEGDCLQIFVKSQVGSDIISHQRVPEQITELIRQEFGVEIKVTLHVVEEDECELTSWVAHQEAEYVKALKTQQADTPNITSGSGVPGNKARAGRPRVIIGKPISEMPVTIEKITEEEKNITVQGEIISLDIRRLKSGRSLLIFDLTDLTDSITVKLFEDEKEENKAVKALSQGMWVKVRGPVRQDKVSQELTIMARDVNTAEFKARTDEAEEKRVELHLHTKMSAMDGVTGIYDAVSTAAKWGHPAIAITDHGVVQAFPDAYGAGRKYGVKIIFGMEGYLIDDGAPIVIKSHPGLLADEEFVVFDLETTGLSPIVNEIIEIGAVKMKQGQVVDRLARFVRPQNGIPIEIQRLTGILPEMVANAADIDRVLPEFME
ncbi:MAG: PHP domain-containing protein, partial [Eubacteriales bacterium]